MKKVSRGTVKAKKLTANEQILNRLAELGERMRVIEDDIERIQGHTGRLAVHQGAITALLPNLPTFGYAALARAAAGPSCEHRMPPFMGDCPQCTGPGSN